MNELMPYRSTNHCHAGEISLAGTRTYSKSPPLGEVIALSHGEETGTWPG